MFAQTRLILATWRCHLYYKEVKAAALELLLWVPFVVLQREHKSVVANIISFCAALIKVPV